MSWLINSYNGKQRARGFTLIELLIVMVVISILVGITIPITKYVTRQARLASQRIYVEKIKSALEDYRAAYGEYPITPNTNSVPPVNYEDALRHYPANYLTKCHYTTNPAYSVEGTTANSPYTNVPLAANTVEDIGKKGDSNMRQVDYCLTYPLMLKQREIGARPFMEFKEETVMHLVYNPDIGLAKVEHIRWFRIEGTPQWRKVLGIRGNPINRPKAVDPVSRKQWKYVSENGVTYNLTTNTF